MACALVYGDVVTVGRRKARVLLVHRHHIAHLHLPDGRVALAPVEQCEYLPTFDEIRERARRARQKWTDRMRQRRRG